RSSKRFGAVSPAPQTPHRSCFTAPRPSPRIDAPRKASDSDGRSGRGMLSPSHSITRCIDMLKRGDRAAAEALWGSYIHRLVALARARLGGTPRRAADEEDVALTALRSFYRRAECGQFARLSDRDDLWQILVLITERKAIDLMRREGRKSRGEGRVVPFSEAEAQGAGDAADPGPTPEFAAQVVDEFRVL